MAHRMTSLPVLGFALCAVAACAAEHERVSHNVGHAEPDGSQPAEPDPTESDALGAPPSQPLADSAGECGFAADDARDLLATYCVHCHETSADALPHLGILEALVNDGFVVPYQPDASPLLRSIEEGSMPLAGEPTPEASKVASMRRWIECGARAWSCTQAGCSDTVQFEVGVSEDPEVFRFAEVEASLNQMGMVAAFNLFDEPTADGVLGRAEFLYDRTLPWFPSVELVQTEQGRIMRVEYQQREPRIPEVGDSYRVTLLDVDGKLLRELSQVTHSIDEYLSNGPGCGDVCRVPVLGGASEPVVDCGGSLISSASQMLTTYCASCHAGGAQDPEPPLSDFKARNSDLRTLVLDGWVIPDDAENSPLYRSVAERSMPPRNSPEPSAEDVAQLREWIACGAGVWD